MKIFFKILVVSLVINTQAFAQAYDSAATFEVGYLQISGGGDGGATVIMKKDKTTFLGCTSSPTQLWSGAEGVSGASAKAMLAALLLAKSTNQKVTVYYKKDSGGTCRFGHVAIE